MKTFFEYFSTIIVLLLTIVVLLTIISLYTHKEKPVEPVNLAPSYEIPDLPEYDNLGKT